VLKRGICDVDITRVGLIVDELVFYDARCVRPTPTRGSRAYCCVTPLDIVNPTKHGGLDLIPYVFRLQDSYACLVQNVAEYMQCECDSLELKLPKLRCPVLKLHWKA
jgi:hypothetical protein